MDSISFFLFPFFVWNSKSRLRNKVGIVFISKCKVTFLIITFFCLLFVFQSKLFEQNLIKKILISQRACTRSTVKVSVCLHAHCTHFTHIDFFLHLGLQLYVLKRINTGLKKCHMVVKAVTLGMKHSVSLLFNLRPLKDIEQCEYSTVRMMCLCRPTQTLAPPSTESTNLFHLQPSNDHPLKSLTGFGTR